MKRFLLSVSLIAAGFVTASVSTSAADQKAAKPTVAVAPADEYFGRLKMSILGIANTIKDDGLKYDNNHDSFPQLLNGIKLTEDAIHDWELKYPRDPWIAKTLFALERFYQKVATEEGRKSAKVTMLWLVHDFPQSSYAKTGKRELAEGKVGAPAETASDPAPIDITKPVLTESH